METRTADVDGDGVLDLVAGVWKKSRFDPTMQKRLFVYGWTGRLVKPKWLGSRLTRRFDDFTLAPEARGPWRLYTLERNERGDHRVSVYEWSGFGFKWPAASGDQPHLRTAIDSGADLVLGCHPHVLQPTAIYRGKPIAYSMGGNIFDSVRFGSNKGGMFFYDVGPHAAQLIRVVPTVMSAGRTVAKAKFDKPTDIELRRRSLTRKTKSLSATMLRYVSSL